MSDATPPWLNGPCSLEKAVEWAKREVAKAALRRNNYHRQRAADELEVNRTTLYKLTRRERDEHANV